MFGRKKKEGGTAADTNTQEPKAETTPPSTVSANKTPHNATRRTVAKPDDKAVTQKSTQILYRLNYAVKQRPLQPSRSTELIPLNKEFEDMRKQVRGLLQAVKRYQTALLEVSNARQDVVQCTAKLATNTPLADAVVANKVVLGESLSTLQTKLAAVTQQAVVETDDSSSSGTATVVNYVTEWEAILTKKIESAVRYTSKLQKNLKHYETKVEKLRKAVANKEEKGKAVSAAESEKLQRNEIKLKESWQEYESVATQTSHLLEEATRHGWKDLHPLLTALLTTEYQRESDLYDLWGQTKGIQDKVAHVVDKYDVPLPASAFATEIILVSRPSGSGDATSDDLEMSDQDAE